MCEIGVIVVLVAVGCFALGYWATGLLFKEADDEEPVPTGTPDIRLPPGVAPRCLDHITDGYCLLHHNHAGPHEYSPIAPQEPEADDE